MAELREIYAAALLDLSIDSNRLDENMQQAAFMLDTLQDGQLESFLVHPSIPDSAKKELLQQLFGGKASSDLMGFLSLAVERSREALILPSLQTFMDLADKHKGKLTAMVVSAVELREEQVIKLADLLSGKMKKNVEIITRVDPAVIGGLYIHIEGRLIDLTVRTQLKNMKEIVRRGVSNDC